MVAALSITGSPLAWSLPQDDAAANSKTTSRWSAIPALERCLPSDAVPRLQPQLAPGPSGTVQLAAFEPQPNGDPNIVAIPAILSGATDDQPAPGAGTPAVPSILSGLEPLPVPTADALPASAGRSPAADSATLKSPVPAAPFQPLLPAAPSPSSAATARLPSPQTAALAEVPVPPALQWLDESDEEIGDSFLERQRPTPAANLVAQPVPVPSILASPLMPLAGTPAGLAPLEPAIGTNLLTLQAIEPLMQVPANTGEPATGANARVPAGNASLVLGEIQPLGPSNGSARGPFRLLQLEEYRPGARQDETAPSAVTDKYNVATMTGPMRDPSILFGQAQLERGYRNQAAVVVTPNRMQVDSQGMVSGWAPVSYTWTTPTFAHNRLYFEQANYERYGMTHATGLEPVVSAAHFYGTVLLMPVRPWCEPHCDEVFTLGHQRPGDCAVHQVQADNRLGMGW